MIRAEHKILAGSAAGAISFSSQVINGPKPKISCTQSKKVVPRDWWDKLVKLGDVPI